MRLQVKWLQMTNPSSSWLPLPIKLFIAIRFLAYIYGGVGGLKWSQITLSSRMTYDERFAVQSPHLSSCNVWQPRIVARIRTKGDVRCHSYDCSIGTNKTSHVRAVTCGSQAVSSVCRHEFQPLASAEVIVTWEESSRIPMCNEGREFWARVALFRAAWFASSIRSDHQQLNR